MKKTRCFFPLLFFRTGKAILGIRDLTGIRGLTVIHCGIRKNEKFLNGVRDDHHSGSRILPNLGTGCGDIRYRGDRRSKCGIVREKEAGSRDQDHSFQTLVSEL